MDHPLTAQLQLALDHCLRPGAFYRCCLLVGRDRARLAAASAAVQARYGWPGLAVGPGLAPALLPLPPGERPAAVAPWLRRALAAHAPGPVVCTEIDLLFEPSLALDPLRLLREASRRVALVVAWPGSLTGATLAYAEPAHAHYRAWASPDLPVACLLTV
jgi:hypothetical protein